MKVKNIAANQTEIETNDGKTILVSYSTNVACHIPGEGFFRTNYKWSKTTSRHINSWLNGSTAEEREQKFFDELV